MVAKQTPQEEAALAALIEQSGVTVQLIAPGVRAAPAKPKRKGGRPRQEGERHPSGKLKAKKPTIEPIAPAMWERVKTDAVRMLKDSRFGSEVGRLSLHGELTSTQASAAYRFAEIYGRFERFHEQRRSAASPSYMAASGTEEDKGAKVETPASRTEAELGEQIEAADLAFEKLQKAMRVFPPNVRAALELLCVEDGLTNPVMLENLRTALDELAGVFRITAAPKKDKAKRVDKLVTKQGEIVAPDADKVAWLQALKRLRPDLPDHELSKAYELAVALKVREVVRRQKASAGRVVYLHPKDAEFRKKPAFRRELK